MSTKRIGTDPISPEALAEMRNFRCKECDACKRVEAAKESHCPNPPFTHATDEMVADWNRIVKENPCEAKWYAYENHDLGHYDLGHMQFLAVGPGCTFKAPPARLPDTRRAFGWRYVPVGVVNLATGAIE